MGSIQCRPINTQNELLSHGRFIRITKNVVFAHKNMGTYCVIRFRNYLENCVVECYCVVTKTSCAPNNMIDVQKVRLQYVLNI